MKVVESMYTYDIGERKQKRILRKIRQKKKIRNLYLVTLPLGGDGLLEVFPYNQLLQAYYQSLGDSIVVVGMAKQKSKAMELLLLMVQDMYDSMGESFDTKSFFSP